MLPERAGIITKYLSRPRTGHLFFIHGFVKVTKLPLVIKDVDTSFLQRESRRSRLPAPSLAFQTSLCTYPASRAQLGCGKDPEATGCWAPEPRELLVALGSAPKACASLALSRHALGGPSDPLVFSRSRQSLKVLSPTANP